jgi:hypothetical protein
VKVARLSFLCIFASCFCGFSLFIFICGRYILFFSVLFNLFFSCSAFYYIFNMCSFY